MRKNEGEEIIIDIDIDKLVILENSRLRVEEDLSELMQSMKEVGQIQPISIRAEDYAVIQGNRRLASAKKLGWKTIKAIIKIGVTDEQLYVINLSENIQRKNISTIEIGRICHGLQTGELCGSKLNQDEIAVRLGIPKTRVRNSIIAFKRIPDKYKKDIKLFHNPCERQYGDIPESLLQTIMHVTRRYRNINDREFELLIEAIRENKLQKEDIATIGYFLSVNNSMEEAIEKASEYEVKSAKILVHKKSLDEALVKYKASSFTDLAKMILRKQCRGIVW